MSNVKSQKSKVLLIAYVLIAFSLFLYSYTQVDLNLTLSRVSIWQTIQKAFQYIGYFQRPLSTAIFIGLLVCLFGLYSWSLWLIKKGRLSEVGFWKLVLVVVVILVFSYPAFSYDMFNYMFTAKTVLVYHKNPYLVTPQQFMGIDPWVIAMRWVHLPSAYTPLWVLLTLPVYLAGFGFFLTIMWSIKAMVAAFHLLTIWGIGKILEKVEAKQKLLGMAIFALNPLIIIENLVSSHNDIVMMALAVWAIILFLEKKKLASWFAFGLSVAAKLMTVFILPVFLVAYKKTINWRVWSLVAMMIGFTFVCFQREVLPWYWVWIMPFVALLPSKLGVTTLASGVSLGLLARYAPFLYLGHYQSPVPLFKDIATWAPVVGVLLVLFLRRATSSR